MTRSSRLSSARQWLATQKGRTPVQIAKSYRKHYGVDWACAIQELGTLEINLPKAWVAQLNQSLSGNIRAHAKRRAKRQETSDRNSVIDSDEYFAFIAGYTEGGAAYGVTWEEWEKL